MKTIISIIRWIFAIVTLLAEWALKLTFAILTLLFLIVFGIFWPILGKYYDPDEQFTKWITNWKYIPLTNKVFDAYTEKE